MSKVQCFTCRKMGYYAAQCPHKHEKEKKKKHHAHATDVEEHKPKDEEFIFISTLTETITQGNDTWLIDSGASRHMTGNKEAIMNLIQKDSPHKVKLGDEYQHQYDYQ